MGSLQVQDCDCERIRNYSFIDISAVAIKHVAAMLITNQSFRFD